MTSTITESFCERCGTRYSFEPPARRRGGGLGRVRVVTRGLRNYVANDGMPLADAMAAARNDEERASTARQLEAFQTTFSFCMSCRQYTCAACWNEKAAECLTCAPDPTREVLPAALPDLQPGGQVETVDQPETGLAAAADAWPTTDLAGARTRPADAMVATEQPVPARTDAPVRATTGVDPQDLTATELEEIEAALTGAHAAVDVPGTPASEEAALEPAAAIEAAAAAESAGEVASAAEPVVRVAAARVQTRSLLGRFRPIRAAAAPSAPPVAETPAAAAEAALEPAIEPGPPAEPAPSPAAVDEVAQPTWSVVAPDPAPDPAPDSAPDAAPDVAPPTRPGQVQVQAPAWPAPAPPGAQAVRAPGSAAAPWAARLATARPDTGSVWAASSQELLAAPEAAAAGHVRPPPVQACVSCGLSLSASARFCRRCGSRQA